MHELIIPAIPLSKRHPVVFTSHTLFVPSILPSRNKKKRPGKTGSEKENRGGSKKRIKKKIGNDKNPSARTRRSSGDLPGEVRVRNDGSISKRRRQRRIERIPNINRCKGRENAKRREMKTREKKKTEKIWNESRKM